MGLTLENVTDEQLCDLMCGKPEEDETMYECFHCGHQAVLWQCDYTFDDMGYEGEGIVHLCSCMSCGAEIEYRIRLDEDEEE